MNNIFTSGLPKNDGETSAEEEAQPTGLARPSFREYPEPYDADGKLKDRYNTSVYRDILSGVGSGVRLAGGRDPYQMFGAAMGGAIAGLFAKNAAGKEILSQDREEAVRYNQQVAAQSEASRRIAVLEQQRAVAKERDRLQRDKMMAKQIVDAQKTTQGKIKSLVPMIEKTADSTLRKDLQVMLLQLQGHPDPEGALESDPNYGVSMRQTRVGDIYFNIDKQGNHTAITNEDGTILNPISMNEWIGILSKTEKFGDDVSEDDYRQVLEQANRIISEKESSGQLRFVTPKGQVNKSQRNSHVMLVARDLLKNKGKRQAGVPASIVLGGTIIEYKVPNFSKSTNQDTVQDENEIPIDGVEVDPTSPAMSIDVGMGETYDTGYGKLHTVNKEWFEGIKKGTKEDQKAQLDSTKRILDSIEEPFMRAAIENQYNALNNYMNDVKVDTKTSIPYKIFKNHKGVEMRVSGIDDYKPETPEELEAIKAKLKVGVWTPSKSEKGRFYVLNSDGTVVVINTVSPEVPK